MAQINNGDTGLSARTMINAVLPQPVSFNATVPLDGNKIMAQQSASSVIAFTPAASPALGGTAMASVIADGSGTHIPTFTGFIEDGDSEGYLDIAGVNNRIKFSYDGTNYYYSVKQAANVAPFAASSAYISVATPTQMTIVYPYNLNATIVPALSAFSITDTGGSETPTSIAISGQTVTLGLSGTILYSDTVTVIYTPPGTNPLTDLNGNVVNASSIACVNGVLPSGSQYVELGSLANMTEVVMPQGGWNYIETNNAPFGSSAGYGLCAKVLGANTLGWFGCKIGGPPAVTSFAIGLQTASTITNYTSISYGLIVNSTNYQVLQNGSPITPSGGTIAMQQGDYIRIRRAALTGSNMVAEFSRDNGQTWTLIHTFTNSVPSTSALYLVGNSAYALSIQGLIQQPTASTSVA